MTQLMNLYSKGQQAMLENLAALAVLLAAAFMPSGVQGQSCQSTHVPDHFEYFEGHGYIGGEWVKWEHDKLVFIKRIADMKGKGSFDEQKSG